LADGLILDRRQISKGRAMSFLVVDLFEKFPIWSVASARFAFSTVADTVLHILVLNAYVTVTT
jgi:hypothetical protein